MQVDFNKWDYNDLIRLANENDMTLAELINRVMKGLLEEARAKW